MESKICNNCNVEIYPTAIFCHKCGNRLKCNNCGAFLLKDANNCISCGTKIEQGDDINISTKNTVTYRKTKDETFFDASLTDNVAKDGIGSLIANITNNRLPEGKFSNKEIKDIERVEDKDDSNTEDIDSEDITEPVLRKESSAEFPHISDVEMTVECSEPEWIAIYAFYESEYTKKTFTKKAVHDKYMAKRKSDSRVGNFSGNWKSLFKSYFSTVNENEIKFKLDSVEHIKNLITGKEKGTVKAPSKKAIKKSSNQNDSNSTNKDEKKSPKKVNSSSGISYKLVPELNLHPKHVESLVDFYKKHETKNTAETVLIIVYYLQKKLNETKIGINKIYTCYKELGLTVPILTRAFENIKRRNGYLNSSDYENITITLAGENHLEHKIVKKAL